MRSREDSFETSNGSTLHYWQGLDVLAQSDGTQTEYLAYDGLGSVRQVTDSAGFVEMAQTFDPYGNLYSRSGVNSTTYGFTGEAQDDNGLLFLRARYYSASSGRFLNADPSRLEQNPFLYGEANPINHTDPFGLSSTLPIGPITGLMDPIMEAKLVVEFAKLIYSKNGIVRNCFLTPDDGQNNATDTIDDLTTDFICEYGDSYREYNGGAVLTRQLAKSEFVYGLRGAIYMGKEENIPTNTSLNIADFIGATLDIGHQIEDALATHQVPLVLHLAPGSQITVPISANHFFGGFDDIRVERTTRGTIRFDFLNKTNIVSGTRIPLVTESANMRSISLEQLVSGKLPGGPPYNLLSILSLRSATSRDPNTTFGPGGGEMTQRFTWEEFYWPSWECAYPAYSQVAPRIDLLMLHGP